MVASPMVWRARQYAILCPAGPRELLRSVRCICRATELDVLRRLSLSEHAVEEGREGRLGAAISTHETPEPFGLTVVVARIEFWIVNQHSPHHSLHACVAKLVDARKDVPHHGV